MTRVVDPQLANAKLLVRLLIATAFSHLPVVWGKGVEGRVGFLLADGNTVPSPKRITLQGP